MKAARLKVTALRDAARFVAYTSSAVVIATLFMIVPLMIVFGSTFQRTSSELLAALGTLALAEIPVVAILMKTTRSSQGTARSEKLPLVGECESEPITRDQRPIAPNNTLRK